MRKIILALFLTFTLAAQTRPAPAPPPKPKLVIAIIVDQFRYDFLTRLHDQFHGGLRRMLDTGADFTNAHYIHVPTVTAVGHSTFLFGATPAMSGIASD